jgi:hypothetical protein
MNQAITKVMAARTTLPITTPCRPLVRACPERLAHRRWQLVQQRRRQAAAAGDDPAPRLGVEPVDEGVLDLAGVARAE